MGHRYQFLTLTPLVLGLIWGYQRFLSPIMGHSCRFSPSCSHYAQGSIQKYGIFKGGSLAIRRILRCHPWGGPGGIDQIP